MRITKIMNYLTAVLNNLKPGSRERKRKLRELARDIGYGAAEKEDLSSVFNMIHPIQDESFYERGFFDALSIVLTAYEAKRSYEDSKHQVH